MFYLLIKARVFPSKIFCKCRVQENDKVYYTFIKFFFLFFFKKKTGSNGSTTTPVPPRKFAIDKKIHIFVCFIEKKLIVYIFVL